jgi:hypothetical protein
LQASFDPADPAHNAGGVGHACLRRGRCEHDPRSPAYPGPAA